VKVKSIENNLKALRAAHKKIGWTLENFEDDLQGVRRIIDADTSDESAARRAALLQKAVDELANNTCLPFMKMWDSGQDASTALDSGSRHGCKRAEDGHL